MRLNFTHNHPLNAALTLSFRPISETTKQQIFDLFDKSHSSSSARHAHEQMLILNAESEAQKQTLLADRATNPNVQDVCRLFVEWRKHHFGVEDGIQMFTKLQSVVDQYNEDKRMKGGRAMLQWYEITGNNDNNEDDSDTEHPPKKKRKKCIHLSYKPLILVVITPLMAWAHSQIQQASVIVFCDSTASLDRFNTSLFIISTATAIFGVPLGINMTSDEQESTIYQAFQPFKKF